MKTIENVVTESVKALEACINYYTSSKLPKDSLDLIAKIVNEGLQVSDVSSEYKEYSKQYWAMVESEKD